MQQEFGSMDQETAATRAMGNMRNQNNSVRNFESRLSGGQMKDSFVIILLGFVLGGLVALVVSFTVESYQFKETVFKDNSECAPCNHPKCAKKNRLSHYMGFSLLGAFIGATVFLLFIVLMLFIENIRNTNQASSGRSKLSHSLDAVALNNLRRS